MDKIEPCDICGMKYTKERCKLGRMLSKDNMPCYCNIIKKIERLNNKIKKLEKSNSKYFSFLMEYDDLLSQFNEWEEDEGDNNNGY